MRYTVRPIQRFEVIDEQTGKTCKSYQAADIAREVAAALNEVAEPQTGLTEDMIADQMDAEARYDDSMRDLEGCYGKFPLAAE